MCDKNLGVVFRRITLTHQPFKYKFIRIIKQLNTVGSKYHICLVFILSELVIQLCNKVRSNQEDPKSKNMTSVQMAENNINI